MIYNQFRPYRFQDVLGQKCVSILQAQAKTHTWGHSYLFYGTSGSGKTTTARITAMSLECTQMNGTGEPCGICPDCRNIVKGSHWDVYELDAARFRGIDDIKDLVWKAQYSPMSRHKVLIIDEAHQLTEAAWNAMLKTLEEPPPHLVIILCTTQADRIPSTVKSRCQLFPFAPLQAVDIKAKLARIASSLDLVIEPRHIDTIAARAEGNCRTAENLLEQIMVLAR